MAKIKPFKGILYNSHLWEKLSDIVAPPYDVISKRMQNLYYKKHPYNVIRLILGKTRPGDNKYNNRYIRAKKILEKWIEGGILVKDKSPSLYIYQQDYWYKGRKRSRVGFISLMRLEDPHRNRILPHEHTFATPKKDRMELLKATKSNLSPIFVLYDDSASSVIDILKKITKTRPIIIVEHEGVFHKLWRLKKQETINIIKRIMQEKEVFIADGHHRYEVALKFREWIKKRTTGFKKSEMDYDYVMVYFSNFDTSTLTVLSTHRVVKYVKGLRFRNIMDGLGRYFLVDEYVSKDSMLSRLENANQRECVFGMYYKDKGFFCLSLPDRANLPCKIATDKDHPQGMLDVTILHRLVFDRILKVKEKVAKTNNILYTRDIDYALKLVNRGGYRIAFFLNPPKLEEIKGVARSYKKMPKKTTYFYPKPLSGLVFYKMECV